MITDFIINSLDFFIAFFSNWGIDTYITKVNDFIVTVSGYVPTFLTFINNIFYFIPKQHLFVLFGVSFAIVIIKLVLAVYNAIAQLIP